MHRAAVGSCREDKLTGLTALAATHNPGHVRRRRQNGAVKVFQKHRCKQMQSYLEGL